MSTLKIKENGVWKSVPYITGPKGEDGTTPSITYQVETLSAGSKAIVTKSGTDASPTLKFGIPRGSNGSTPSVANYIPKTGSRGTISSYTSSNIVSGLTINQNTPEESQVTGGTITVEPGIANTSWTKLVNITDANVPISLGDSWIWSKGEIPTVSDNCILICHWCNDLGIAYIAEGGTFLKTYTGTITSEYSTIYVSRNGEYIYTLQSNNSSHTVELAVGDIIHAYIYSSSGITFTESGKNSIVKTITNGFTCEANIDPL